MVHLFIHLLLQVCYKAYRNVFSVGTQSSVKFNVLSAVSGGQFSLQLKYTGGKDISSEGYVERNGDGERRDFIAVDKFHSFMKRKSGKEIPHLHGNIYKFSVNASIWTLACLHIFVGLYHL